MANKKTREARRNRRDKIRLGPSERATAFLNLLGIELAPYPTRYLPQDLTKGLQNLPRVRPVDLLKTRTDMKCWIAKVTAHPHITKLLYCTCDEHWMAEARLLKLRAENAAKPKSERKSIIMVWLPGGQSHIDTYDPKPDASSEWGK